MTTRVRKSTLAWFILAGMVIGFLLVHPFAMIAYTLSPQHPQLPLDLSFWSGKLRLAFSPGMLHMGLAFILLGGLTGTSLGAWHLQKERLAREKLESQQRLAALNTLRELMVTLAHYIRNANVVIGGFSVKLSKQVTDPELQNQLRLIHQASQQIEAVVASLQDLTELRTLPYTAGGQARMIDLKKELEAHLAASKLPDGHIDA